MRIRHPGGLLFAETWVEEMDVNIFRGLVFSLRFRDCQNVAFFRFRGLSLSTGNNATLFKVAELDVI